MARGDAASRPQGSDAGGGASPLDGIGLAVVLCAQLVVVLDFSIVNVALPDISEALAVSQMSAQWVVTAYAITFGGLLVLGGRMADLFGRRRLFVGGLVGFALASAAGGLAADFALLVAARALQGVAAAVVAPAALSILTTAFHGPARTRVLGYYGATASVGFVLGLVLGGILVELGSWRAVFFVNVPVCLMCAASGKRLPVEAAADAPRHVDAAGAVLVTAGMGLLVYSITAGAGSGWTSAPFVVALVLACGLLAAFVLHERRSPHPLVRLSILRSRTIATGNAVTLLVGAWTGGEVLVLSLFCQQVLGYSPLQTGLVAVPQGVGGLIRGAVGPSLVTRLGVKWFLAASAALSALGLALVLRVPATSHYPGLGVVLFLVGFGTTSAAFGAVVAGTAGVADDEQGLAGALVNAARQVGSAVGVATLLSIAATATTRTNGGPATPTAAGYRLAMGAAAGLAVLATVLSAVFIHAGTVRRHHERLRSRGLHEPWPRPEHLARTKPLDRPEHGGPPMPQNARRQETVAVLGTGTMGRGMAASALRAGIPTVVWDRTPDRAGGLAPLGADVADTAVAAAARAGIVITMVSDADAVLSIATEQGMLDALPPDGLWAQMSTIGVDGTDRVAELVRNRRPDVTLVDAPVSGSREPAEQGQLIIFASGPDEARERLAPIFDALGQRTVWVGPLGAGSRMKLVSNTLLAFKAEGLAASIALAHRLGLETTGVIDALGGSPLLSPWDSAKLGRIADDDYSAQFPLGLALKDVHLALETVDPARFEAFSSLAHEWERAVDHGLGDDDLTVVTRALDAKGTLR